MSGAGGPRRTWRDHPREYGENAMDWKGKLAMLGSSPRIRGKWRGVFRMMGMSGIIPANTGKIISQTPQQFAEWDHPREYGENSRGATMGAAALGSSPRIRGKSPSVRHQRRGGRIIPANTGKMQAVARRRGGSGDHPREYGENSFDLPENYTPNGSSPRIRGKSSPRPETT